MSLIVFDNVYILHNLISLLIIRRPVCTMDAVRFGAYYVLCTVLTYNSIPIENRQLKSTKPHKYLVQWRG